MTADDCNADDYNAVEINNTVMKMGLKHIPRHVVSLKEIDKTHQLYIIHADEFIIRVK